MRATKRQPASVGEMLQQEFLVPLGITAQDLAKAIGVHRNTISNLKCGGTLTVPLAIKLAKALGNSPEFWMNIQHAVEALGITYEEAIIQVLMGAIVESLDEF